MAAWLNPMEVQMNPNKAGLVLMALAAQWALTEAPLPLVSSAQRPPVDPGHSKPKPLPGDTPASEGKRPEPTLARIGPLALNP